MNPTVIEVAQGIALEAHGGAVNKHDGELYLLHVHRVAILAREWSEVNAPHNRITNVAVAWLHDVAEDTGWTLSDIRFRFSSHAIGGSALDNIMHGVDAITKRAGESNEEYYLRVKAHWSARAVKLHADMIDNFRRNHLIVDEATRARMAKKYSLGVDILSS